MSVAALFAIAWLIFGAGMMVGATWVAWHMDQPVGPEHDEHEDGGP